MTMYILKYQKREGGPWNKLDQFAVYAIAKESLIDAVRRLDDGDVVVVTDQANNLRQIRFALAGEATTPRPIMGTSALAIPADFDDCARSLIVKRACFWNIDIRLVLGELLRAVDYISDITESRSTGISAAAEKDLRDYASGKIPFPESMLNFQTRTENGLEALCYLAHADRVLGIKSIVGHLAYAIFMRLEEIAADNADFDGYWRYVASKHSIGLGEYLLAGYKSNYRWNWM